jgi:hypothetical protein
MRGVPRRGGQAAAAAVPAAAVHRRVADEQPLDVQQCWNYRVVR